MPVELISAESTDLFTGSEDAPCQVLRVTVRRSSGAPIRLDARGSGVVGTAAIPPGDGDVTVELPVTVTAEPGTAIPVVVSAGAARLESTVVAEAPGYTMYLVSHFHYDPVWWNTQAAFTSPWEWLSGDATTRPLWERNGFALVDAHLDLALRDPDYRFVLAEIDYLKPYFDTHPQRRADLRRLLAEGRVELLGGMYNEPNTNLTGAETTIRNIVYGIGYQRDILGGDPQTAWQLDVFGHDPQFPGYLAAAGLTASAWARGPYHQWGPVANNFREAPGDATVMQFPSEFEWIAPSGLGVLTHYMPSHYSAGWWMDSAASLADAEAAVYDLYRTLKPVAATRHILLPVGTDYTPPNRWVTAIHRSWRERYVWPRFVCGIPRDFLAAVRAELAERGVRPSPQTRDMNPIYTGKDVSYVDTKQAQRAAEVAATDAEKLATIATLLGLGRYPHAALDKVWRQLAYGAHHDAITGSESDQVYIDLLGGWREAHDLAAGARDAALDALVARVDLTGDGRALVVTNTLSFERTDLVRVAVDAPVRVVDDAGVPVPSLDDHGTLILRAERVPALGWRTYRLLPVDEAPPGWSGAPGVTAGNERYAVTADPDRGGVLSSIVDRSTGRELLCRPGNELRSYAEYPTHPKFGEGPWHLLPSGPVVSSSTAPATVRRLTSPLGERLVATGTVDGLPYEQTTTLWYGQDRVDFRTRVVDHAGVDKLLRVKFAVDVPGALPVSEVASAVVGRGYALPDVDTAEAPWTLDNPANTWFGLGATARVSLRSPAGNPLGDRAIGVAEVVVPALESAAQARDLVVALVRAGVTATVSSPDWSRYGWLDVDSNLPDVRIVLGGPADNALTAELLGRVGPEYAAALERHGVLWIPAERPLVDVWQPNADLRDVRALPALIVAGDVDGVLADLAGARITATALEPPAEPLSDTTVALLTYGLPGFAVDPAGGMHLSLMRSCTGWPSGVWLDPPRRTAPDGSAFQLQHWTHEFDYALVSGDADWRALRLPARGQEHSTPLLPRIVDGAPGDLPSTYSFLRVEPARDVLLSTLKPAGNPIAAGREPGPVDAVTIRLAESTGLGARATLSGALDLAGLARADLLERPHTPVGDEITLAGFDVTTLVTPPRLVTPPPSGPVLGMAIEPAQPVFARYWLHNRGPAPMGYLPVTVSVSPGIARTEGGPVTIAVVLATSMPDTDHEGIVELRVPDGWTVEPAERVYRLAAGAHVTFDATVTPAPGAPVGLYFVAARIAHGGQLIEDVATVVLGDEPSSLPQPGPAPPEDRQFLGTSADTGPNTGVTVDVTEPEVVVAAGERAVLGVALGNGTRDEIRGEVQLVAPWGTWTWLPEVIRGFALPAGAETTMDFEVAVPAGTPPGHAWALAKVMWYGRCQYTRSVGLVVSP